LGDCALIFADGRMEGFVGGSCSRDIVRRQALGVLDTRQPVLLQIRNAAPLGPDGTANAGEPAAFEGANESAVTITERVVIPMSCASEGAVDVYIEPRAVRRGRAHAGRPSAGRRGVAARVRRGARRHRG